MPHQQPSPTTPDFSGFWVALVTPFRDGAVDHAALSTLVRRLASEGVTGFVPCGSTGEAAALDETEQLAVLDTVLAAAGGLPVVMGISGYHLGKAIAWARKLSERPIAGLLVAAPHYVRPSQAGLLEWFRAIADASSVPVLVYDIPYRTGVTITRETMLALAAHPRIRGIKDCGGDMAKTRAVIADGRRGPLRPASPRRGPGRSAPALPGCPEPRIAATVWSFGADILCGLGRENAR